MNRVPARPVVRRETCPCCGGRWAPDLTGEPDAEGWIEAAGNHYCDIHGGYSCFSDECETSRCPECAA